MSMMRIANIIAALGLRNEVYGCVLGYDANANSTLTLK